MNKLKVCKFIVNRKKKKVIPSLDTGCRLGGVTQPLQEKSKLEMDNLVSNPSGNGIPDGLEMEFPVFKTLVSNCVHLNSVSN